MRPLIERRTNVLYYSGIATAELRDQLFSTNRIHNTLNIHFTHISGYAGSAGKNPWDGLGYSCYVATSGVYDDIRANNLIHDLGHTLGLFHTHRGRNRQNNETSNNGLMGECWQESVSRSKKQGIPCNNRGTLKCEINGDALCDTDADPELLIRGNQPGVILAYRVSLDCNSFQPRDNDSKNYKEDNWNDAWLPPGNNNALRNIMSHSRPTCRSMFSPLQKGILYRQCTYNSPKDDVSGVNPHGFNTNYQVDVFENDNAWVTRSNVFETYRELNNTLNIGETYHHTFNNTFNGNGTWNNNDVDWKWFTITNPLSQNIIIKTNPVSGQANADTEITLFSIDAQGVLTQIGTPHDNISPNNLYSQIVINPNDLPVGDYAIRVRNMQTFQNLSATYAPATPHYYLSVFECFDYADPLLNNVDLTGPSVLCLMPSQYQVTNLPAGFEVIWVSTSPRVVRQDTGFGSTAVFASNTLINSGSLPIFIYALVRRIGCTNGMPLTLQVRINRALTSEINGNASLLCEPNSPYTFNLQGNFSPQSQIAWTATPSNILNISNPNTTTLSAEVLSGASGLVTLTANINSGCANTTTVSRQVWVGKPATKYTLIAPYKQLGGKYIFCPNQSAKFTFQIPNNNPAAIHSYECIINSCVVTQETIQQGDRTELVFTVENLGNFDPDCEGNISVRAVNDCGEGEWQSIPFIVTHLCNITIGIGSPCPPNVLCDRLSATAYENPFIGGFRYRLDGLPWVDYPRVTDATLAEFDYTVQVLDNQGDLKRQIQTNTVQTHIDMANLPTGNYYVRAVFQNGSYTSTKTVVKQ